MSRTNQEHFLIDLSEVLLVPLTLYCVLLAILAAGYFFSPQGRVLTALGSGIMVFSAGTLLLFRRTALPKPLISPSAPWSDAVPLTACALLGASLALLRISIGRHFAFMPNEGFLDMARSTKAIAGLMMPLWVIHAFAEEYFFRGYVERWLGLHCSRMAAALVTAAAFSATHLPYSLDFGIYLFLSSLAYSYFFARFGALLFPIAAHSAVNIAGHAVVLGWLPLR